MAKYLKVPKFLIITARVKFKKGKKKKKKGWYHNVALPFTLKSISRQKKNYENSNVSRCKSINLKKNPLKETKKSIKIF
jgi:hypothetical protein